jgi:hypothetical protein
VTVIGEYATIRTLSLGTRAHLSTDMSGWWAPAERRGRPRTIPGVPGAVPRPVVLGPVRFLHTVWVDGRYDVNNDVNADPRFGWETNLELLYAACEPNPLPPWTFPAVHHLPDDTSRSYQIQVLDIVAPSRLAGVAAEVALDILIPSGVPDPESALESS